MKGQRKKAMWAKKRVENAAKREAERKENTVRTPRKKREFVELKPRESKFVITEGMAKVAALPSARGTTLTLDKIDRSKTILPEDEYKRREAAARAEIERKKKQIAPLWNKGGLQYIGDAPPEIIETLGRKV